MYRHFLKRVFDLVGSITLFPFIILIILVFGILIKIEDHGPIFYIADRLGKNGKIFKMYKLRSMKVNAPDLRNPDGSTFCSSSDERLTKWGKFVREKSIDELPQVINVLFGNMSFVGPRPDLPEAILIYKKNEITKLEVLPGITGYSQAYHRNSINMDHKFVYDVNYVDNLTFILDIKIMLKTFYCLIYKSNVFNSISEGTNNH